MSASNNKIELQKTLSETFEKGDIDAIYAALKATPPLKLADAIDPKIKYILYKRGGVPAACNHVEMITGEQSRLNQILANKSEGRKESLFLGAFSVVMAGYAHYGHSQNKANLETYAQPLESTPLYKTHLSECKNNDVDAIQELKQPFIDAGYEDLAAQIYEASDQEVSQCALQKTGEYVQELKKDVGTYPLVGEYLLVAAGISIAAARAIKWKNAYKSAAEQTAKIAGMTFTPD